MSLPLTCVYVAAVATTLVGVAWSIASHVWGRTCVRHWDDGIDP